MLLKIVIVFIFILILFFFINFIKFIRKNKVLSSKKLSTLNKRNLNKWMNLTKKERYNLSKQESINYLNKRKVLLEEIRNEYKKISKGKSKNT
ncbi:MAG: glycoprotein [Prochlorococcus marinus CUG1438]|nr:glycoprotein [Prochlorococcus marinus CUG1438]|tara:strand:+ start:86 stop:364 length:279 start_codon:yes stop_codon:yes gene_type:complete